MLLRGRALVQPFAPFSALSVEYQHAEREFFYASTRTRAMLAGSGRCAVRTLPHFIPEARRSGQIRRSITLPRRHSDAERSPRCPTVIAY